MPPEFILLLEEERTCFGWGLSRFCLRGWYRQGRNWHLLEI